VGPFRFLYTMRWRITLNYAKVVILKVDPIVQAIFWPQQVMVSPIPICCLRLKLILTFWPARGTSAHNLCQGLTCRHLPQLLLNIQGKL